MAVLRAVKTSRIVEATFRLEKETSGALRFREIDENDQFYESNTSPGCKIGTIYIRKSELNGDIPQAAQITIQFIS